ncbi:FHIPEP family type III secretion protein [Shigella flexneri]
MVFIILALINFMVITRCDDIAEVGARFVLYGMPGKTWRLMRI